MTIEPQVSAGEAALRRRLEEAEDTLRAIRDGEVDALVVRGERTDEVFTLQGGTDSYRAFMETMDHGAVALGPSREVLYANAAFCALLDQPLEEVQGRDLGCVMGDREWPRLAELLERARQGKRSVELVIIRAGASRYFLASAAPLQTGVVAGWALTLTDLTDRVLAEKSMASERAARAIIASANEAVVVLDIAGRVTHANAAVANIHQGELLGRLFHEAVVLSFPEASGPTRADSLVETALAGKAMQGIEAHVPEAPRTKDVLLSAAPLCPTEGTINGCVITMVDLSQRKLAEKQQLLLMGELHHRVKNTLALVLAILGRTREDSVETFKEVFSARIHALASTHNLLAKNSWSNLTLGDILAAELAPHVPIPNPRIEVDGGNLQVGPRAAVALGMIFHELATNAVKYGALSGASGKIVLKVQPFGEPRQAAVIDWIESGGPEVATPTRMGFGQTMITRSLQYSPQGGAELIFDPTGLHCRIRVPPEDLSDVQAEDPSSSDTAG